jgi:hypothetical protein
MVVFELRGLAESRPYEFGRWIPPTHFTSRTIEASCIDTTSRQREYVSVCNGGCAGGCEVGVGRQWPVAR